MPTSPKDTSKPRTFEGDEVVSSSITIPNAGGGLREALEIDPVEFHRGDEVWFVVRGKVRHVAFPPEKAGATRVVRQHTIDAEDIAIVPEEAVAELMLAEKRRVQDALELLSKQLRTDDPEPHPFAPDPDDATKCFECGQPKSARWHKDAEAE